MNENVKSWIFLILSWVFAIVFLLFGFINYKISVESIYLLKLCFILFGFCLLILPFITKIKVGNFIELERKISKNTEEIVDFKNSINYSLSNITNNINSIKNNIKLELHIPSYSTLIEDNKKIEETIDPRYKPSLEREKNTLIKESEDKTWALIKNKIEIEKKLRSLLGKQLFVNSFPEKETKYISFESLINKVTEIYGIIDIPKASFDNYRRIVNSVMHGQVISEQYIEEAIKLGIQLKKIINKLQSNRNI